MTSILERRRTIAWIAALALIVASAAVVSADPAPQAQVPDFVVTGEEEDEAAEEAAEASEEAAEESAEASEEAAEEAAEDAADDCQFEEPGSHGANVCAAAQAWKNDGSGAQTPPDDHGATVSAAAQDNHGADIQEQKDANGGIPDAAASALANAGPNGDGPPGLVGGRGDDDEEEEEDEEEEDEDDEEEEEGD